MKKKKIRVGKKCLEEEMKFQATFKASEVHILNAFYYEFPTVTRCN